MIPKGPWKYDPDTGMIETANPVNFKGDYAHICDLRLHVFSMEFDNEIGKAIEALPDLADAARVILPWIDELLRDGDKREREAIEKLKTALAKIGG